MLAGPTLGQVLTSLQAKGYGTDTRLAQVEAINSVYRRVLAHRRWSFMETRNTALVTTANVSYVTLSPTDLLKVTAVRIEQGTDYPTLEWADEQELRENQHADRVADTPITWTQINSKLEFWPIPDGVYTITLEYTAWPAAVPLVNDNDVLVIPSAYLDVITWGAVWEMAYRERDVWSMELSGQQYAERLSEMDREYGVKQLQTGLEVVSTGIWDRVRR